LAEEGNDTEGKPKGILRSAAETVPSITHAANDWWSGLGHLLQL